MSSSRLPRPRTTSATPKAKATPASSSAATPTRPERKLAAPPTLRTKVSAPKLKPSAKSPVTPAAKEVPPPPSQRTLSIKEQIALRRAEQQKKATSTRSAASDNWEEGSVAESSVNGPDDDILGRWSIRDTIDRAKSSGSIVLASRELTQIPTYLFESHLSMTPEPLKNSPPEVVEPEAPSKIKRSGNTTWYEQVDLTSLKIWDNELVEIQPEISLFGSLKIIDLHKNKLRGLPDSFMDLMFLTNLDLSYNEIEELPTRLASLPHLSTLNVSHNKLSQLPFIIQAGSMSRARSESFFSATVERATVTLPSLRVLQASHNQLRSDAFQPPHLPKELLEIDLSNNPLGPATRLFTALEGLERLKTLRMASCDLTDDGFPTKLGKFSVLQLLDLGENDKLSEDKVADAMGDREFEIGPMNTNSTVKLHVIAGKPGPVKEAWEIEVENRARTRKVSSRFGTAEITTSASPRSNSGRPSVVSPTPSKVEEPQKEQWEIEAEQGLLTEAGRRRARAAAAAATTTKTQAGTSKPSLATEMSNMSISGTPGVPSLVQFYDGPHATLTLPRLQPQSRTHNRSFSIVPTSTSANASDLVVPLPTFPLPTILAQTFANSIRVLILSNRRMESSVILPSSGAKTPILPHLEELVLDNCNLSSQVPIALEAGPASSSKESLLDLIASLFPSLGVLDLSYNALTTLSGVGALLTPDPEKKRKGLTALRLRGNRLASLDSLEELAEKWKNAGGVEGWRGEEIDLRDNEIGRLPPLLGLLPLDVLLVDGNTFRIPPRRVWEKEGTQGLLKWLSERI